ncbi:MAG TPA: sugar-binding transcriptional regulator [Actinobacteria bacterium]|jgi:deoxyribonucleoside regulator|nr:sugar-binding transcriptional regulator [Actinomycetota bacterium]
MAYDFKLMVKVATLYYKDRLTQDEIAQRIKVSKYQVNRILKRALEAGIVQITINDSMSGITDLEDKLEKTFGLKRAIVIDNNGLSDKELKVKMGQATAGYLMEIIKNRDVIGIAWGTTVNEVINHLPRKINKNVKVVQVTGGIHQLALNLNCQDIARRLADKFDVEPHLIYAPAIVESKNLRDLLLREQSIRDTFKFFKDISIALVGIGAISKKTTSTLVETGSINEEELKKLKNQSAVGDVFSHFIDINGNIVDKSIDSKMITISTDDILKIPYLIGVAGGESKAEAVLAAMRGKYVNILVTDSGAASGLLKI